jgi:hypothetical protein
MRREDIGRRQSQIISQNICGNTEEYHENLPSVHSVSPSRLELSE